MYNKLPSQSVLRHFKYNFNFVCYIRTGNVNDYSIPSVPSIHDPPVIRRPGDIIDASTLIRNHWSFPAVGFNSILEIPVYNFESYDEVDKVDPIKYINVPNDIFGLPLRPDILHRCYQFYRRAKAGYYDGIQLYKWEWPGSTKKWRKQQKSGKARIGWKKSPGKYLGVFAHPVRPHDQRTNIQRRLLYLGLKIALSAKFAQAQIQVVDSFLMKSHKTKYAVKNLRKILGKNCNSALLVFSDYNDSNENFRWSTANIPSVRNEVVDALNVYNILKYRQLVITEAALGKLIYFLQNYPKKCDWLPKYATPDNKPAPPPTKVKGWNNIWIQDKIKAKLSSQTREEWLERVKKWKWSSDTKGALKVPRYDPFDNFKLTFINYNNNLDIKTRYQYLYDSKFYQGLDELDDGDVMDHEELEELEEYLDDNVENYRNINDLLKG